MSSDPGTNALWAGFTEQERTDIASATADPAVTEWPSDELPEIKPRVVIATMVSAAGAVALAIVLVVKSRRRRKVRKEEANARLVPPAEVASDPA